MIKDRADLAARLFLTLAALLPYWRLLTFGVVFVTDDYFASDIFNGELPGPRADRPADPRWTAARVDEPAVLGVLARGHARRSHRAVGVRAVAARRGARPLRHRAAARRGARRVRIGAALRRRSHGRRPRRHRVRGVRLHRLPAQTPLDRLHGGVAAGRTAADRSRARRGGRGGRPPGDARAARPVHGGVRPRLRGTSPLRLPAVGVHLRAPLRRVRAVPRHQRSPAGRTVSRVGRTPRGAWPGHRARCRGGSGRPPSALGARQRLGPLRAARLPVVHGPGLLAAEHPDVPRAVHQRRHLRQFLRRPAVLLGRLRLRRRRDASAGALRHGARAAAACRRVRDRDDAGRLLPGARQGDAGVPRRLRAAARTEALSLSDQVPHRRGARHRTARRRRADAAARGSGAALETAVTDSAGDRAGAVRRRPHSTS